MQVAVAGVEDVRAAQAVLRSIAAMRFSTAGEPRARDRAVHAVVVGRDAAHRRERGLAPGPEARRARRRSRDTRMRGGAGRARSTSIMRAISSSTSSGVPSDLAEQDRRRVEVVAGVHELLDRARHRLVHHLEAGRDDAGGDDCGHRVAGLLDVVEAPPGCTRAVSGFGTSRTVTSVVTASMPSEPVTSASRS